jgi:hypothetical protein
MLTEHLTRRFIAARGDAVVVTGRIPDIDSSELCQWWSVSTRRCSRPRRPSRLRVSVTGLAAIAATQQRRHDRQAQSRATIESVFVAAFIGWPSAPLTSC